MENRTKPAEKYTTNTTDGDTRSNKSRYRIKKRRRYPQEWLTSQSSHFGVSMVVYCANGCYLVVKGHWAPTEERGVSAAAAHHARYIDMARLDQSLYVSATGIIANRAVWLGESEIVFLTERY
ncbi:hypothetical protein TNCV_1520501 [Trichonephila clavipes]|nr:hypothetical protein TNCV_1520501 [Trichonephila clavipes]